MSAAARLTDAVAAALGTDVTASSVVRGGDVAAAYRLTLADGRTLFAKTHPSPPPGFFTTEAAGLRWLREPGVIAVPEVLAVSDGPVAFLVLEWIDDGRGGAGGADDHSTEADLGRALAALHRAGAPCFGREDRRTTGSRALPNEPCDSWTEFYATQRLLPLARLARDGNALPAGTIDALERLTTGSTLASLPGADEPPSRLHGDLWAGNRLVDGAGRNWLIDPAAHGGHREFDLATMRLFRGFGSDAFAAYQDIHPLAPGWEDRVSLHQIAPLVVHAVKFGSSYVPAATRVIETWS